MAAEMADDDSVWAESDAALSKFFDNVPVLFGLARQGHIPTIERMLAEGKSWSEIGEAIGWCGETARGITTSGS
jgi:hypothetical protein